MPNGDLYSAIRDDGIGRFAWTRKPGPSGRPLPNTGLNRRIALDIARGLHFLHSRRVVHLDLKSPNILLARDFTAKGSFWGVFSILFFFGFEKRQFRPTAAIFSSPRIRPPSFFPPALTNASLPSNNQIRTTNKKQKTISPVADVGLSKILRDRFLSTMQAVGTFAWAAPEVLLGKPTSESADIYSFGVLLWELSTAEAPPGRALRELEVPEEAPQEVADLVARCLEEDPARRPTALELVHFFKDLDVAASASSGCGGGGGGGSSGGGGARGSSNSSDGAARKSGAGEVSAEDAAKAAAAAAATTATSAEAEVEGGKPTLVKRLSKKISKVLSLKNSSDKEAGAAGGEAAGSGAPSRAPTPPPAPAPARPQLPNPFGGGGAPAASASVPAPSDAAAAPSDAAAAPAAPVAPRVSAAPFVSSFGASAGGPPASAFGDRAAKE